MIKEMMMKPRWKQVGWFVGLTYALSWTLNLVVWLGGGYEGSLTAGLLQLQMLVPALVAIVLQRYIFRDSSIHVSHYQERPRQVFNLFLGYAGALALVVVLAILLPDLAPVLGGAGTLLGLISVVALFILRARSNSAAFAQAGLSLGRASHWVLYSLLFILYYASQTALTAAFGLGTPVDVSEIAAEAGMPASAFVMGGLIQSIVVSPVLIALFMAFGEEYGWRGYLQGELVRFGKVRGVALTGLIWGVWHLPAILLGHNYPGRPFLGSVLMIIYTLLMAFVFGYVMLKTRAIWLVALLHAINNHTYQALTTLIHSPNDAVFAFSGAGIYSIAILAVIVALLLRDPLWREDADSLKLSDGLTNLPTVMG
jgi:uncharacterized protein